MLKQVEIDASKIQKRIRESQTGKYRAKLVTSQTMENLNKIEYKMTNFNRVEIIKQDNLKNRVETRIQTRIEKIKKFFSIAAPTVNLRKRGRGYRVENVCGIYSAGKYADLAICVRTQNDFNLKGGITTHSDNKTRLKQPICVYNGHYARKRNRNTAKNEYLCNNITITCIFMR